MMVSETQDARAPGRRRTVGSDDRCRAEELAAVQEGKDDNRKSAKVNSDTLSLLRIMQKRLHSEVNP